MKKVFLEVSVILIVMLAFSACGQTPAQTTIPATTQAQSQAQTQVTTQAQSQAETPASAEANAQAAWKVAIVLSDGSTVDFTDKDANAIGTVDIKATLKKKDGSSVEQQWTGVLLSRALEKSGVTEYSSITVEAGDGYKKDYTPEIVKSADTVIGIKVDGQSLDEKSGPVELVAGSQSGNMWIKNLVKITVVK